MDLSIQEGRLRRQRDKDLAELKQKQEERSRQRQKDLNGLAIAWAHAKDDNIPLDHAEFGFDFSLDEIAEAASHFPICSSIPECQKYIRSGSVDRVGQYRMNFQNRKAA